MAHAILLDDGAHLWATEGAPVRPEKITREDPVRRIATVLALSVAVLSPGTAWAQQSPSPSPTPTPAHGNCGPVIDPTASPVPAWGLDGKGGVTVTVRGGGPNGEVTLFGYTRPATEVRELARGKANDTGTATFPLAIQGNTRVYAVASGCAVASEHRIINVQARFGGLTARRNGPRDYTFSAFYAGPAGKVGNLYRVLPDGREVLTSQTRLAGEWPHIRRVFTGSGRFGFVLRAGNDINSLGASSTVRDTVIH